MKLTTDIANGLTPNVALNGDVVYVTPKCLESFINGILRRVVITDSDRDAIAEARDKYEWHGDYVMELKYRDVLADIFNDKMQHRANQGKKAYLVIKCV